MPRIIVVSDLHIPQHHKEGVDALIKRVRTWHPGKVVLLGDILDSYSISRYLKDPAAPNLQEEIDATKDVLRRLRAAIGRGCIEYLSGNHEDRLRRVLWEVPGLNGLKALSLPELLGVSESRWRPYDKDAYLRIGSIAFHHGGDTKRNTEGTAKERLTAAGEETRVICCGHTHRLSVTYIRDRLGLGASVETGCLQDPIKADYLKTRKLWDLGWIEIYTDTGHSLPRIQPVFL